MKYICLCNYTQILSSIVALRRCHHGRNSVSNHQPHDCLLNRLFRRKSKKTSKLRVTGLCAGIHRGPVNSPHKWPVTRKMFPFDDIFMICLESKHSSLQFHILWRSYGQQILSNISNGYCNNSYTANTIQLFSHGHTSRDLSIYPETW